MKWAMYAAAFVAVGVLAVSGPGAYSWVDLLPPPDPAELRVRNDALTRAKILRAEPFDGTHVDFTADPNRELVNPSEIRCRFLPTEPTGTTLKFDCELPGGQKIKVKYLGTREIPAEVAATRLLHGLGFGADHMSHVATVRCYGCVISPFHIRSLIQKLHLERTFDEYIDYDRATVFRRVGVERKLEGESIEAGEHKGWAFYELSRIDPARGGATSAVFSACTSPGRSAPDLPSPSSSARSAPRRTACGMTPCRWSRNCRRPPGRFAPDGPPRGIMLQAHWKRSRMPRASWSRRQQRLRVRRLRRRAACSACRLKNRRSEPRTMSGGARWGLSRCWVRPSWFCSSHTSCRCTTISSKEN